MITVGDIAPDFTLDSETEHNQISLSHFRGRKVVLFFYPKDSTPGCTKEACDFRDYSIKFQEKGVVLLGISKDSAKSHKKFKEKYALPFSLLVDRDAAVSEAYNVVDTKSWFGKTFLGVNRSTFLIDEKGVIRQIWRKVKVPKHVEEVLAAIELLTEQAVVGSTIS